MEKHHASGEMTFTNGFNKYSEDTLKYIYLHIKKLCEHTHPQPEKKMLQGRTKMLTEVITEWWD